MYVESLLYPNIMFAFLLKCGKLKKVNGSGTSSCELIALLSLAWSQFITDMVFSMYMCTQFGLFGEVKSMSNVLIHVIHDDVIKWKHFPRYWPFVRAIHRSPVNSPHKGQWRGALMFPLIYAWINGGANNCEAGDLRRHYLLYLPGNNITVTSKLAWWRLDCLLNPLFRCRPKKRSKLRVTGLGEGNPLETGGFPSQRPSDTLFFHLVTSSWYTAE